ncbi:MAG: DUF4890 domain-containing protein [Coprobacter sp.]|nr:DUF4890 domain-containing protein [Coprobacter sp.]
MKKFVLSIVLLGSSLTLMAQVPVKDDNRRNEKRERITPEMIAQKKTEKMRETVELTDKQFKKLYKVNLAEAEEMFQNMPQGPRMRQGGERGNRPQGMREGAPRGNRPQGMRPDGQRGGRPGMEAGGRPGGPRPQMGSERLSQEQLQKNADKREKKIKKIMGKEKYAKWQPVAEQWKKERRRTPARPDRTLPTERKIQ